MTSSSLRSRQITSSPTVPQPDTTAPESSDNRSAWAATITASFVVAAFVAGKAARDAILLASFDIKMLPLFVGISAAISLPVILITGKLLARFGPGRLMPVLNVLSAAVAVVEWMCLARYPRATAIAIFFHLSTSGAVLVSGFWSIINERFHIQSAKRHIGRIGMGATLGGIVGGVIAQATAVYLTADNIMLVLAALQLSCAVTLYLIGGAVRREPTVSSSEGTWSALQVVAKSALLRNVGIVVVLGAIAAGILDYVFKADIVARSSKDGLLHSLAIFYTATSVITAIIQATVCAPLIARLGVPRSVGLLPLTVTAFGLAALAIPTMISSAIARCAESITRNSVYRAGYELLYAPLDDADKRPAKIILDVGAERVGDLLGAQLVAALVFFTGSRTTLLGAAVAVGALTLMFALRIPRAYTKTLANSLVVNAPDAALPRLGQAGDIAPLPLRFVNYATPPRRAVRPVPGHGDNVIAIVTELRASDPARVRRALTVEIAPEIAGHVVHLLARDDVGPAALTALRAVATRCTGMLVDVLLDPSRDELLRRRMPEVLASGEPARASWGLQRGLSDPSFAVRVACGVALAQLASAGHLTELTTKDAFEAVRGELHDPTSDNREVIEHVFTLLGLALPVEPLRIALQAIQTEDSALRETALEYLESILPSDLRTELRPFLVAEVAEAVAATIVPRQGRSKDELLAALRIAYPVSPDAAGSEIRSAASANRRQ